MFSLVTGVRNRKPKESTSRHVAVDQEEVGPAPVSRKKKNMNWGLNLRIQNVFSM